MELKGETHIENPQDQPADWVKNLYLLYYPLMGLDACMLYCLLSSVSCLQADMERLVETSGLGLTRFEKARQELEQFLLLQTFYDASRPAWLLVLKPVMSGREFFANETFSRLLLNEKGGTQFEQLEKALIRQPEKSTAMKDISADFDATRLERTWDAGKERTYERLKPKTGVSNPYGFDFDKFFYRAERVFPIRLRTDENLSLIAQLAGIHGISEKQMMRYVQRCVNPHTNYFDRDQLRELVLASREITAGPSDPYAMAPSQFLAVHQNGAPVSRADKELIDRLVQDYQFPFEVVNTLIEYTLERTNQQFSRTYVEKVAGTWKRLGIDSRARALEQIRKPAPARKSRPGSNETALPDWYADTEKVEADDALLAEVARQLADLEGEKK